MGTLDTTECSLQPRDVEVDQQSCNISYKYVLDKKGGGFFLTAWQIDNKWYCYLLSLRYISLFREDYKFSQVQDRIFGQSPDSCSARFSTISSERIVR